MKIGIVIMLVVLKTLVLEHAWVPCLVHSCVIKVFSTLEVTHVIKKITRLSPY